MKVGDLVKLLWNDANYYGKTGIVISLQKPPTTVVAVDPSGPREGAEAWANPCAAMNTGGDGDAHPTLVQWLNDASAWWVRRADLEVVSESR